MQLKKREVVSRDFAIKKTIKCIETYACLRYENNFVCVVSNTVMYLDVLL